MCHRLLRSASFQRRLFEIDGELAASAKARGCAECGAVLHCASYPRKPRGVAAGLGVEFEMRHSFCCSGENCRKRLTPRSVRFLDRRVYLSVVVTLAAVLVNGVTPQRCQRVCKELGVSPRTLARWREWWQQGLPRASFFAELRAGLACPLEAELLPNSLLDQLVLANEEERWIAFLRLIAPASHSELMRARWSRVA